jgi:hypothetical protein
MLLVGTRLDNGGHIWEIFYADESQMPEEMKNRK